MIGIAVGLFAGVMVRQTHASALIGSVIVATWFALVLVRPGAGVGLWAVAAVNGLPFLNMDRFRVPGAFRPEDMLLGLLLVAGVVASAARPQEKRGIRLVWFATGVFVAVWALTLVRSTLFADIPILKAALYGRDFLFFPLTAIAAFYILGRRPHAWSEAMLVVSIGAVIYAAAQLVYQLVGVQLSFLVRPYVQAASSGVVRPYQWTAALVWLLVVPVLALVVGSGGRRRWLWLTAAALLLAATYFGQTRAVLFGVAVAGVSLLVLMARTGMITRRVGTLYSLVLAVSLAVVLAVVLSPPVREAGSVVLERYTTLGQVVSDGTQMPETWSYRRALAAEMRDVLARDWPWGLGFLHPDVRPVAGLPSGSIRNNDLGMMQVLMTMGAIGVIGLMAIVLAVLLPAVRWLWGTRVGGVDALDAPLDASLASGLLAALVGASASSLTLGMFIDGPAAMATGVLAAMLMSIHSAAVNPGRAAEGV